MHTDTGTSVSMEQRAEEEMGKKSSASASIEKFINQMKKKTKAKNERFR